MISVHAQNSEFTFYFKNTEECIDFLTETNTQDTLVDINTKCDTIVVGKEVA